MYVDIVISNAFNLNNFYFFFLFFLFCREWLTWLDELKWLWRLGWLDFFVPTVLFSTFIPFFLTSSPLSLIVLFQSCWSHAQVLRRTLLHEFLFSYSHTEWNLLSLKQTPLWHEATWDKPEASIKTETEEEDLLTRDSHGLETLGNQTLGVGLSHALFP